MASKDTVSQQRWLAGRGSPGQRYWGTGWWGQWAFIGACDKVSLSHYVQNIVYRQGIITEGEGSVQLKVINIFNTKKEPI